MTFLLNYDLLVVPVLKVLTFLSKHFECKFRIIFVHLIQHIFRVLKQYMINAVNFEYLKHNILVEI